MSVARNHYSVPCELARQTDQQAAVPGADGDLSLTTRWWRATRAASSAARPATTGATTSSLVERKPGALSNGAPFAGMPESLIRLQRLLLKRDGGDRVMSQMLAVVPKAGLEAVLVAVELVLESGVVSVEHVLNVIGRLKQDAPPEAVQTHLDGEGGADRRHGPLRPLAQPGDRPCVRSPRNSKRCACTAWPGPGAS